jgi:hypothetical protein
MKKILFTLIVIFSSYRMLISQTIISQGKPVAEIFTDFHYSINDTSKTTGFGITRAHLGYKYTPEGDFSALLMINIGTPEDLAEGSVLKRYAFFREASIAYKKEKITVNFGMVSTRYEDFQQAFWGKRYLGPEYQAAYGYGSVADLGVVVDYRLSDLLKFDFSLLNGKGYSNVQYDNSLKTAFGFNISTSNNIFIRLYGDLMRSQGILQNTLIGFAGIKNSFFSIGVEGSHKTNLDLTEGHDVWGISSTGSIFLNKKTEIFARYDYAASVKVAEEVLQWDYQKDATYFIGGIQRTLNDYLIIALNYRRMNPYAPGEKTTNAIYINARFRFL